MASKFSYFYFLPVLVFVIIHIDGFQIRGFDNKAYGNGSEFPAYKNNSMRVYGMRFDPFTHKVMLVLAAKNISFELISLNLKEKPEWYAEDISPLGKIPCVQYNDKIVCGSALTTEWIDDEFDQLTNIMPEDPYSRARQKMLLDVLEQALPASHVYKALYFKAIDSKTFGSYDIEAAKHEALLKDQYYNGKQPGWIDYMIWPQLEKIDLIPLVFKSVPPSKKFPKFSAYLRRMRNRPEVKVVRRPARDHLKYALSLVKEKPEYDIGVL